MDSEFCLSELMCEELILLEERCDSKTEVIELLVDRLVQAGKVKNREELLNIIMSREKLGSTGVGRGVAIPHGRTEVVKAIVIAFARIEQGVDFDSLDGKPVHLVFLLLTPEKDAASYLKALSRLSRLLKKDDFRKRLLCAQTPSDVIQAFLAEERTTSL